MHFWQTHRAYFAAFFLEGDLIDLRRDDRREVLILLGCLLGRDWLEKHRATARLDVVLVLLLQDAEIAPESLIRGNDILQLCLRLPEVGGHFHFFEVPRAIRAFEIFLQSFDFLAERRNLQVQFFALIAFLAESNDDCAELIRQIS